MEQDQSFASDHREQRMLAVAKLKRAASLPRMKDGRRPPMHVEAVSEGERGPTDDDGTPDIDTPPPEETVEEPVEVEIEVEPEAEADNEVEDVTITPPATRSKRRSRSRTRSRSSRDFKGKARNQQSPTPSPLYPGDSSQDEATIPLTPIALPTVPPLMSPVPSHAGDFQPSRLLRSPTPNFQDTSPFPYPVSPPTPLPSLEAISKNLFRSNSAGRMMAMHKLTGGTETYEPSPSPTPPVPGKFRRNNTVSGGERDAARKLMLNKLANRSNRETDNEQGSGPEESVPTAPSPTPKRRRRRSRRGSSTANAGLSDSEFLSTTPNTPLVPPTPLPTDLDMFAELRARSVTPSQIPSLLNFSPEPRLPSLHPLPQPVSHRSTPENGIEFERPEPTRRRSVVIEEEEDERAPAPPATPPHRLPLGSPALRVAHTSDAPSNASGDSRSTSVVGVPVYLSSRAPSRLDQDIFPSSPFMTPLKEKPFQDEEEEEVLYPAEGFRNRLFEDDSNREISWVASPVPEIRMPIDDDEDDLDEEDELEYERPLTRSSNGFSPPEGYENPSPRDSSDSQNLLVEVETSPDITPSYVPPSPSSVAALSQTGLATRASDESESPHTFPARLSVASRIQNGERSPTTADFTDVEDRSITNDSSFKRNGDSTSTSTWERVKNTFTRSNSTSGRRSRSNSIVTRERRDHTDSSISRESGVSLNSAKTDRMEAVSPFSIQQTQQPLMQSQSASASYVSLSPTPGSRGGVSPAPPPSADLAKYQNSKLFPFPGMQKLQEQRNRAKGLPASASTPDVSALANLNDDEQYTYAGNPLVSPPFQSPFGAGQDHGLTHQISETGLMTKYNMGSPMQAVPSNSPRQEYIDIIPAAPTPSGSKLPMTLPGVKQWLNNKKIFSSQSSSPSPSAPTTPAPIEVRHTQNGFKKPSLSDLLRIRKENELTPDWEDLGSTPTSTSGSTLTGKPLSSFETKDTAPDVSTSPGFSPYRAEYHTDTEKTPKKKTVSPPEPITQSDSFHSYLHLDLPTPTSPDPLSSATPDPSSSLSDYPAASTSESSSTTSSHYSSGVPGLQGSMVMDFLDENLGRGSRNSKWASTIEEPPRKTLLCSPVLQVVNANTVKDRFLFLFTDLLVIAKAAAQEGDNKTKDRKFIVKSVVKLQNLRFTADRAETQTKSSSYATPRTSLIKSFIHQFNRDPDYAISTLLTKSGIPDDPTFLGQLLFRTLDLDRAQMGEYLSQRTSKLVLKSYVDSFGFGGLRIDKALRAFLLSLHVPSRSSPTHNSLDSLLDAFASRWYEANAGIVAYDKDMAIRLVRTVVQLNEFLHGGIAQESNTTSYPMRSLTGRHFAEAFRRFDARRMVPDELLEEIYDAIRQERLCQARIFLPGSAPDAPITIKRTLPRRLTYKVQSEPIVLRIPQADPDLSIQLYGQGLVFDPPVLTFNKSSEVSFRVMGTSLGPKTMIMCRSGRNAVLYSGLPFSNPITIERAFMRNTFQVAFCNHSGTKRRYMFSIEDAIVHHEWVSSLKRQIDLATSSAMSPPVPTSSAHGLKFYKAAEAMAFRTLQETLTGSDGSATAIHKALQRLGPRHTANGSSASYFPSGQQSPLNGGSRIGSSHVRSKSRSQVYYHHHGGGRHELDLENGLNSSSPDNYGYGKGGSPALLEQHQITRSDAPLWTDVELQMYCQQNSSIAMVLSFLPLGILDHGQRSSSP